MLSQTQSSRTRSPATGVIPDPIAEPVSDGPSVSPDTDPVLAQAMAAALNGTETPAEHFRRKALRGWLQGYAIAGVALTAFLIALAASNTAHVKVNWVFGSSHVALVWLVLFAAIVGWALGMMVSARLHWRTRAPYGRGAPPSPAPRES